MSEDRNFVARWSRLKRETDNNRDAPGRPEVAPESAADTETPKRPPSAQDARPGRQGETFDPSSLPPIDSITAGTDIRDFLQSGVPAELTKAALRRAWSADPAIRDFIGLAENQWDFTDPAAIPGFGPLQAGDNVQDLVAQAMGKLEDDLTQPTEVEQAAVAPDGASSADARVRETRMTSTEHGQVRATSEDVDAVGERSDAAQAGTTALQHEPSVTGLQRRKHGRALPKPA